MKNLERGNAPKVTYFVPFLHPTVFYFTCIKLFKTRTIITVSGDNVQFSNSVSKNGFYKVRHLYLISNGLITFYWKKKKPRSSVFKLVAS